MFHDGSQATGLRQTRMFVPMLPDNVAMFHLKLRANYWLDHSSYHNYHAIQPMLSNHTGAALINQCVSNKEYSSTLPVL